MPAQDNSTTTNAATDNHSGGNTLESLESWSAFFNASVVVLTALLAVAGYFAWKYSSELSTRKDEELTRFKVESAKEISAANARSAEANQKAEQLRADNLALQRIMQPRRLGSLIAITNPDEPDVPPLAEQQFWHILEFAGTPVLIQVVPDFEAQTLANDLVRVLRAFRWNPALVSEAVSHLSPISFTDGVRVTYPPKSNFSKAAYALATGLTNAGLTGSAGGGMSRVHAQGFTTHPDGTPVGAPFNPTFDKPVDAVIVLIGMKPIPAVATPGQK